MSQPLAFTFVTPWYHHFSGGAEVAIRLYAEQLDQRGFDVEILTSCCRGPYESWWKNTLPEGRDQINGITVRRFPIDPQGEAVLSRLDARRSKGETLDDASQREYVRHMFNSPTLIEYARHNTVGRMIIAAPYPFGMVNQLATELAGRVSLMSCLHDEPWLAWVTTRDTLAASQRMLYLTEEEKSLAVRHFGREVGRSLVESPVTGLDP